MIQFDDATVTPKLIIPSRFLIKSRPSMIRSPTHLVSHRFLHKGLIMFIVKSYSSVSWD